MSSELRKVQSRYGNLAPAANWAKSAATTAVSTPLTSVPSTTGRSSRAHCRQPAPSARRTTLTAAAKLSK